MKKYTYYFNDGTKNVVEVSEELCSILENLDNKELNNNRRNTRRHSSLEMLLEKGIEFEKEETNTIVNLEFEYLSNLDNEKLKEVITTLTPSQQNLIYQIYVLGLKQCDIAKQYGMQPNAINNRLKRILNKIKSFFD